MPRRIFISFQYEDQMRAKGFNLLRWNRNVDIEFVGRHLLDPVNSTNETYVRQCIREQLTGTSVTVVLLGRNTHDSEGRLGNRAEPCKGLSQRAPSDPPSWQCTAPAGVARRHRSQRSWRRDYRLGAS
jgi:hypothetical protein